MSLPKISVITPSYNQGNFIEETIQSVISQNYPNIEYIIIDGGSTDQTIEIIKKHEQHLYYWISEKDKGQSEAINKGFKKATGEIVCWLNSDDIFLPNALHTVAVYFEENTDIKVVNGYLLLINQYSNILGNHFILKQKKWYARKGIYYIAQPAMFWKRKIFDSIGFLREDFHTQMDKEFLIRIFENEIKVGQLKKILSAFRMHNTSKGALGVRSDINIYDVAELEKLYHNTYSQKPKLFYMLIYGFEKFLRCIYLKKMVLLHTMERKKCTRIKPQQLHLFKITSVWLGTFLKNKCKYFIYTIEIIP